MLVCNLCFYVYSCRDVCMCVYVCVCFYVPVYVAVFVFVCVLTVTTEFPNPDRSIQALLSSYL